MKCIPSTQLFYDNNKEFKYVDNSMTEEQLYFSDHLKYIVNVADNYRLSKYLVYSKKLKKAAFIYYTPYTNSKFIEVVVLDEIPDDFNTEHFNQFYDDLESDTLRYINWIFDKSGIIIDPEDAKYDYYDHVYKFFKPYKRDINIFLCENKFLGIKHTTILEIE